MDAVASASREEVTVELALSSAANGKNSCIHCMGRVTETVALPHVLPVFCDGGVIFSRKEIFFVIFS
jgi:hypothetical protein